MRVYLTINDIQKLSEGKIFRYEDTLFKPSYTVMDICKNILARKSLLDYYTAVLDCGIQTTYIYLEAPRKRRRRRVAT